MNFLIPSWPAKDRRADNVRFHPKVLKFVGGFVDEMGRGKDRLTGSASPVRNAERPLDQKKAKEF